MSKQPPPAAATAATANMDNHPLGGLDIGKVMSSTGPMVKCVLLRATPPPSADGSQSCDNDKKLPAAAVAKKDIGEMSIKEIKAELVLHGVDASLFVEKGELVKALKAARLTDAVAGSNDTKKPAANDNDTKAAATADNDEANIVTQEEEEEADEEEDTPPPTTKPVLHQNLIEEILVDTTPRKSMVSKILGGEFTFLGQYEEEGIMVMVRRPDWELVEEDDDEGDESGEGDGKGDGEKEGNIPPVNPHELQPPLHDVEVRGDILLMRVAETEEELDRQEDSSTAINDENGDENGKADEKAKGSAQEENVSSKNQKEASPPPPEIHVPTNDEFFLDYTKEEYLKFAARTDIVAKEVEESDSDSDDEEGEPLSDNEEEDDVKHTAKALLANHSNPNNEEEEEDQDFDPDEEEDSDEEQDFDSEEHQIGMMNMILSHMLRKFREENGRGPDSLELLEMRKALADRLGVDVPPVDETASDWDKKLDRGSSDETKKRVNKDGTPSKNKKVVVDEERNETEEIPCREDKSEDGDSEDEGEHDVNEHEHDENDVVVSGHKRPAQDGNLDEKELNGDNGTIDNKKARLNGEIANGSSAKDDEEASSES